MHKKIALLIEKIIEDSPYDHFTCKVIPNPSGGDGFWEAEISFSMRNDAHAESLVRILKPLGMIFGEGLYVEDLGNKILVG